MARVSSFPVDRVMWILVNIIPDLIAMAIGEFLYLSLLC